MNNKILSLLLLVTLLDAKEIFTTGDIDQYLNKKNPFVYATFSKESIYKQKEEYRRGAFDTKLGVKYDKKEYPTSKGKFLDISLKKPIENGMEFTANYRKAEGTQEYNNIKTGKDGEVLIGVKLPVFSLIKNTNTHKLHLKLALLDSIKYSFNSKNNLRILYKKILKSYYTLLYYKILLDYQNKLLNTATTRASFIAKRIASGLLPKVSLVEAQQQIINRKQNHLLIKNNYEKSLAIFLQYLNLSQEQFFALYRLDDTLKVEKLHRNLQTSIDKAIHSRADLKMLLYEKDKIKLQKHNATLLTYPKLHLSLYGVHDFKYDNGFKIALNMTFPIERRKYFGKTKELKKSLANIENIEKKKTISIQLNLTNLLNSLKTLEQNIEYARQEITLAKKLKNVEERKYKIGSSTLFMLNQRESYLLEVHTKLLKYKLNYLLLKEEYKSEIGQQTETDIFYNYSQI